MSRYVELRLIATQWVPNAERQAPSRRQAMRHFRSLDARDLPQPQRKVVLDDENVYSVA